MSDQTATSMAATDEAPSTADDELIRSGRDADVTRRALVRAARRRFATDGYRATTVRQIAADAGVNVALINRYFVSKEGLFEACMLRTSDELETQSSARAASIDDVITSLIEHVVNAPDGDDPCSSCCCCARRVTRTPTSSAAEPSSTSPVSSRPPRAGTSTTRPTSRSSCGPSSRSPPHSAS